MPFSDTFLNKVLWSQIDQLASAHRIGKISKFHLLSEHDRKVQPVGRCDLSSIFNTKEDPFRLLQRLHGLKGQSSDEMDLVVATPFQIFETWQSFPFPYLIPNLEHPPTILGKSISAWYYILGQADDVLTQSRSV